MKLCGFHVTFCARATSEAESQYDQPTDTSATKGIMHALAVSLHQDAP